MQVKDVPLHQITGIAPSAPLREAINRLQDAESPVLPVSDGYRLVGTISEHDVVRWQAADAHDLGRATVRDAMNTAGDAIAKNEDVGVAVRQMQDRNLGALVVVGAEGRPVGTVSLYDLQAGDGVAASRASHGSYELTGGAPEGVPAMRVMLQPIAAPSILGLFGFAGATFIVSTWMAHWYGTPASPMILAPFAAVFGGLAQFLAGMWSYRARDGLATAMHGMWGSFWIAWGLLYLLAAAHLVTIPVGTQFVPLGFWFIALAAITWSGFLAALAENITLAAVLGTLAAGSTLAAIALIAGIAGVLTAAGWVFMVSSLIAFYLASAMMLEGSWKRIVLPLGKYHRDANVPGRTVTNPVQFPGGQPGVKVGQ